MTNHLQLGISRGQPYGGVGFLWRKSFASHIPVGHKADFGRCLSLTLNLDRGKVTDIISVYFPCFSNSVEYTTQLDDWLSFIEDVLVKGRDVLTLGDVNFECQLNNAGYKMYYSVSQKKHPRHFSSNSRKHCRIFIMFDTHVTEKESNQ